MTYRSWGHNGILACFAIAQSSHGLNNISPTSWVEFILMPNFPGPWLIVVLVEISALLYKTKMCKVPKDTIFYRNMNTDHSSVSVNN